MSIKDTYEKAFILPATILLGVGTAMVSVMFMQTVTNISELSNSQIYSQMARNASAAGSQYMDSCVQLRVEMWTKLAPDTDCAGVSSGSNGYLENNTEYRTTFNVSPPVTASGLVTATSVGTTEVMSGGIVAKTYTSRSKITLPSTTIVLKKATGKAITDLKAQSHMCGIANGELYCWGYNGSGQLGDNTLTDRAYPVKVGGQLAGKTVTTVDVSVSTTCAVADGTPYCWGNNDNGQLGSGNRSNVRIPTTNYPDMSAGSVLNGYTITDIATSPPNVPAFFWPLSIAAPHTCALRDDGAMSCWGSNGFRQLSTEFDICVGAIVFGVCVGFRFLAYWDSNDPLLVHGYRDSDGPFAGKKAIRAFASSHDSCLLANGRMYCMGVEVPLAIQCNTALFYPGNVVSIPFGGDLCTGQYSPGYDMSAKDGTFTDFAGFFGGGNLFTNYSLNNSYIDPPTMQLGTNIACGQADNNAYCVGNGSAAAALWGASWTPPWKQIANSDMTSNDNGDNESGVSLDGQWCAIDKGIAKCIVSPMSLGLDGGAGVGAINPITTTNYAPSVPTKIAAGTRSGCVLVNARLYCWGAQANGRLADGVNNFFSATAIATRSGDVGANPIGTDDGTFAATNVAVGDKFSCGLVDQHAFCWGQNDKNQLGNGSTESAIVPTGVTTLVDSVTRDIAAGSNHACAISLGDIWCWGDNSKGQLGLGSVGGTRSTPQKVPLAAGLRAWSISARGDTTCAVINGRAFCWGDNATGQVGNNTAGGNVSSPTAVTTLGAAPSSVPVINNRINTTQISVGWGFTCAVANANAYCWGKNTTGQLGDGTTTQRNAPVLVKGTAAEATSSTNKSTRPLGPNSMTPSVSQITAGDGFACGVFDANVACWGDNSKGQLGDGSVTTRYTPKAITGAAANYYANGISAGRSHVCAMLNGGSSATNGNMWCWGDKTGGKLGDNVTSGYTSTPMRVYNADLNGKSTTEIAMGDTHGCTVSNANIICWGAGTNGQLGNNMKDGLGNPIDRYIPTGTADYIKFGDYTKGVIY